MIILIVIIMLVLVAIIGNANDGNDGEMERNSESSLFLLSLVLSKKTSHSCCIVSWAMLLCLDCYHSRKKRKAIQLLVIG